MNVLILVREPRGLCLSGMPMNTSEGRSDLCESWKLNLGILGLAQLEAMGNGDVFHQHQFLGIAYASE